MLEGEGALYLPFLNKFIAWPLDFDVHGFASKHDIQIAAESIVRHGGLVTFLAKYSNQISGQESVFNESCDLGCFSCGKTLIKNVKVFNTPAENWRELLDCWACHKESFLVSTQATGLLPKEGVAFRTADSLIIKSESSSCSSCNVEIGVSDGAGNVKYYISRITLNGKHRTSDQVLIDKLESAKDLHSVHSFEVSDPKGNSFGLGVISWDSIIFQPDPVRGIVFRYDSQGSGAGERVELHEHDFCNVLESIKRNNTPLGLCYLRKK